VPLCER
jgi:hypothetical protein